SVAAARSRDASVTERLASDCSSLLAELGSMPRRRAKSLPVMPSDSRMSAIHPFPGAASSRGRTLSKSRSSSFLRNRAFLPRRVMSLYHPYTAIYNCKYCFASQLTTICIALYYNSPPCPHTSRDRASSTDVGG